MFHDAGIITDSTEEAIMGAPRSNRTKMLLDNLALNRTGNTSLFYKILLGIHMHKKDINIQQLAAEMKRKFELPFRKKSTGMYITTLLCIYF